MKTTHAPLIAAITLALSACGGATPTPAPTAPSAPAEPTTPPEPSAPTAAAAPAASLTIGDPLTLLSDAMRKQLTSGPYRSKTVIVSADGTTEGTGEFIPPDRLHIVSELGQGQRMEMIYVGEKGWSKDGDAWKELKLPGGGPLSQIDGSMIDDMILTLTDVKLVGPELLDGRPMIVVSYVSDLSKSKTMTMDVKSNVKVWIGATDGRIYKQVIEGDAGGVASTTTQTVEYDPGIVIEAPAP